MTAGIATPDTAAPLPPGFAVSLDADTKELSDGSLFGGSPARVLRLTAAGRRALDELRAGPIRSAAAAVLARRLTDAGLAHPVPHVKSGERLDVTVLIPVRDRAGMLDRCLAAVADRYPVVVVDDGSADRLAVATIAARYGALVLRRERSGGPAAARNTGLAGIETEVIAFLDSDCVPPPGWLEALGSHLADPQVGAVAPRIVSLPARTAVARYEQARGSLDLGGRAARVVPGGRVAYVPTAALLVRRAALDAVTVVSAATVTGTPYDCRTSGTRDSPAVFDPALRYGEDVDLIWRLNAAGWRIRYEPSVQVPHESPADWPGLLGRRFRYGTSAAPLARRHPANLAPLVLQPWPAATVCAALARRPVAATAGTIAAWLDIAAAVRRAGVPADGAPAAALTAIKQSWLGIGRYAGQFASPALVAALAAPGRNRAGRRMAAASLLFGPALTAYAERRPQLDPVRYALAHIADDVCYGAGVWVGCLRDRTMLPVTPVISRRPVRVTRPPTEGARADGMAGDEQQADRPRADGKGRA
jgi:GT2 family glycosyltransferase